MSGRRFHLGVLALLVALLLLVYGRSLDQGFHYDDFHSIVDNPHLRDPGHIPAFFADPALFSARPERAMYRPLLLLTYALNHALGGYGGWGWHLFNILVHALCSFLVYSLGSSLGAGRAGAFLGGVLFALHPLNGEVVYYVSARSESLAGLFVLASLLAWLRWRRQGGWGLYALSLAAFALALLSKSVAAFLPAALLLWEMGRGKEERRGWRPHLGHWVLLGLYLLVIRQWLSTSLKGAPRPLSEQIPTQIKALAYYLHLLVAPLRLSVEHPFSVATGPAEPAVLLSLALLLTAAFLLRGRRPWALLAGWALLALLPASLVPLHVLVNEHRLYLPLAFVCAGLGWGAQGLGARLRPLVVAVPLVCGLLVYGRGAAWESERALWSDAVDKAPHAYRAHMHLGGALEQEGEPGAALEHYQRAAALDPQAVEAHYNVGNALRLLGRVPEAQKAYERALALDARYAPALINLAGLAQELGQGERAGALLERALEADPRSAEAHLQLGVLYRALGRTGEAERAYRQALALRGEWAEAYYNLGNLLFDTGREGEAEGAYREALRLDAYHAGACRNLGDLYLRRGDFERAGELFARGLRQRPGEAMLYYGLARAQEGMGQVRGAVDNYRKFLHYGRLDAATAQSIRQHIEDLERGD